MLHVFTSYDNFCPNYKTVLWSAGYITKTNKQTNHRNYRKQVHQKEKLVFFQRILFHN